MLDFVSVMIDNKREDNHDKDSLVLFSHHAILEFLEMQKSFLIEDQVLRIFILAQRFRLSLEFMKIYKIPFNIEFFLNSIESNAYDISFNLLNLYEEQIFAQSNKAIDSHVKSY